MTVDPIMETAPLGRHCALVLRRRVNAEEAAIADRARHAALCTRIRGHFRARHRNSIHTLYSTFGDHSQAAVRAAVQALVQSGFLVAKRGGLYERAPEPAT